MIDITTNPTYKKIRRRALSLRKLDLSLLSDKEILILLKKSFDFAIEAFPQKPGVKPVYRARVNEDANYNPIYDPFDNKNDISYLKNPTKYGRCNIIGDPVFYGADGLEIAVCELCNGVLSKEKPTLYLTVGGWRLNNEIEVSIICHSKRAQRRSGDLIIAYKSLLKLKKSTSTSKSEIRIWKIINKFLSNEFSKKVQYKKEFDYKISALFANQLLKSSIPISGIFYPSVGYRFYGHNVAYDKSLIDNGTLVLDSVKHVKCTFVHKNKAPKVEIIKSAKSILGDNIIWI